MDLTGASRSRGLFRERVAAGTRQAFRVAAAARMTARPVARYEGEPSRENAFADPQRRFSTPRVLFTLSFALSHLLLEIHFTTTRRPWAPSPRPSALRLGADTRSCPVAHGGYTAVITRQLHGGYTALGTRASSRRGAHRPAAGGCSSLCCKGAHSFRSDTTPPPRRRSRHPAVALFAITRHRFDHRRPRRPSHTWRSFLYLFADAILLRHAISCPPTSASIAQR